MSNVYVVQETPGRNLLPATEYGEVRILLPPGQIVFSSAPTVRRLRAALRNFNDDDYLLLMGDPVAIGAASAVASHYNQGRIKMLKWDRQYARYVPVEIDLHGRITDE
jgi:hypothetical protein